MYKKISTFFFIGFLILAITAQASHLSDTLPGNTGKYIWLDLRWGYVGDLKGTGIQFPATSLGVGGNYQVRSVLYTLRLNYNMEMIQAADAPPGTHIWDLGILAGKNFTGGRDGMRKITLSGGLGMIWASKYVGTGIYTYMKEHISSLGFIVELKIFWTFDFMGVGFGAIANINPDIHYFGGIVYIPIGSFK
jgi:hypothetical protein